MMAQLVQGSRVPSSLCGVWDVLGYLDTLVLGYFGTGSGTTDPTAGWAFCWRCWLGSRLGTPAGTEIQRYGGTAVRGIGAVLLFGDAIRTIAVSGNKVSLISSKVDLGSATKAGAIAHLWAIRDVCVLAVREKQETGPDSRGNGNYDSFSSIATGGNKMGLMGLMGLAAGCIKMRPKMRACQKAVATPRAQKVRGSSELGDNLTVASSIPLLHIFDDYLGMYLAPSLSRRTGQPAHFDQRHRVSFLSVAGRVSGLAATHLLTLQATAYGSK
ncbi:hypothetical protein CHU98_g10885 [Xylaria longipes]|nr:hypothetical protein CHU98_g10885 [Xylaria longipes]